MYCERSCQKRHWKTEHRYQCSRVLRLSGIDGSEISVTPRRVDRVRNVRYLVEATLGVGRDTGAIVELSIGSQMLDDRTKLRTLYPMADETGMLYTVRELSTSCPSCVSTGSE